VSRSPNWTQIVWSSIEISRLLVAWKKRLSHCLPQVNWAGAGAALNANMLKAREEMKDLHVVYIALPAGAPGSASDPKPTSRLDFWPAPNV